MLQSLPIQNYNLYLNKRGQLVKLGQKIMDKKWKILKAELEYKAALKRTIELFHADENTPEGEELDLLLLLVKDYEDRHYHIPDPDPIEAIKLKLEEKGLKQKDLVHIIGSKGYVSQVLSGKKELTLKMVKGLHQYLGISTDVLLAGSK
jgi:HTH-type transcriptional regulator/antitoxin HigA